MRSEKERLIEPEPKWEGLSDLAKAVWDCHFPEESADPELVKWEVFDKRLRDRVERLLSGDEEQRNELLMGVYAEVASYGLGRIVQILQSPKVVEVFERVGRMKSSNEYLEAAKNNPEDLDWMDEHKQIRRITKIISAGPVLPDDDYVKFDNFPFKDIVCKVDDYWGVVASNIGHDLRKSALMSEFGVTLFSKASRNPSNYEGPVNLALRVYPHIWKGELLLFELYRSMVDGEFPKGWVNLSELLEVVGAESAVRAGWISSGRLGNLRKPKSVNYNGVPYETSISGEAGFNELAIDVNVEPGLRVWGSGPALKMLFYQIAKNGVGILREEGPEMSGNPALRIDAGKVQLEGADGLTDVMAVVIEDNGPGLDLTQIWREKQRLLKIKGEFEILTEREEGIADDWMALNLRIVDVVNFILERRLSGRKLEASHSGIGLGLAKEFVEMNGGCIWVTNNSGENGAKFMVLLDPSSDGGLKKRFPELFPDDEGNIGEVPGRLLRWVEDQLKAGVVGWYKLGGKSKVE